MRSSTNCELERKSCTGKAAQSTIYPLSQNLLETWNCLLRHVLVGSRAVASDEHKSLLQIPRSRANLDTWNPKFPWPRLQVFQLFITIFGIPSSSHMVACNCSIKHRYIRRMPEVVRLRNYIPQYPSLYALRTRT